MLIHLQKLRQNLLAVADDEGVHEQGERLRIDRRDGAANDDKRVAFAAILRFQRQMRQFQHGKQIQIIVFKRDRKGEDVEIRRRRLRFQRAKRGVGLLINQAQRRVRQKDPFAADAAALVEQAVNRLHAQIRHADRVGVGISQRNRGVAVARCERRPNFPAQFLVNVLPDAVIHLTNHRLLKS